MSLTSIVDDAIAAREPAFLTLRMQPVIEERARIIGTRLNLAGPHLRTLQEDLAPLALADPKPASKTSNILDALIKFIPTEVVTLYLAAIAAAPALHETLGVTSKAIFWFFVFGLTPALFVLIMAAKRAGGGLPALPRPRQWPYWKLVATMIAFFAWALAVPSSPYLGGDSGRVVAALFALFASTILSLADPFMERIGKPAPATTNSG